MAAVRHLARNLRLSEMAEEARGGKNFGHYQQRLPPETSAVVLQKTPAQEHNGELYRRAVRISGL